MKEQLAKKIEELKATLAAATPEQIEKSERDAKRQAELLDVIFKDDYEWTDDVREEMRGFDLGLHAAKEKLHDYEETMKQNLVKIETRYVICSGDLISPAGFHPDEKVFIQPAVCIQTNDRNAKAPSCNLELKIYDLDK